MTGKKTKEDRLKALREDSDYQELLRILKRQTPEQVDAFLDHIEEEQAGNEESEE